MRLLPVMQPIEPETRVRIMDFLRAVGIELSRYTFSQQIETEAFVRFASRDIPEYPKLFVGLKWAQSDQPDHRFEGSISLSELKRLGEESYYGQVNYVYHFARMLLSSLALSRIVVVECEGGEGHRKGELLCNGPCTTRCNG